MPLNARTWLDDEPSGLDALKQAVTAIVQGLRRPFWTFGLTIALSVALGGAMFLARGEYAPRFVLRVVEANRDPNSMPRLKRELAEYVRQAVFTSGPLMDIMARHGLSQKAVRRDPRAAMESFRKEIRVDVYQNYFVEERVEGQAPRSARVALSYRSEDPEEALAVTRELGALVVDHEKRVRRDQALAAAKDAERARDTLRVAIQQRGREIAEKRAEVATNPDPDPALQVALVSLTGSLAALERQAEVAEKRATKLELGAAFEQRGMGLSFEVADDASLPNAAHRGSLALLVGGISMLLAFPLVALGVGTFGARGRPT